MSSPTLRAAKDTVCAWIARNLCPHTRSGASGSSKPARWTNGRAAAALLLTTDHPYPDEHSARFEPSLTSCRWHPLEHPSAASLAPFQAIAEAVDAEGGDLLEQVSALIDRAQSFAAAQANATLTLRNWHIGRMIDVAVLHEERAGHDTQLVASLGRQLTARYGRGFERANLYRMVQFSQVFPDVELVASVGRQVSWTHFKALLPIEDGDARAFYLRRLPSGT